MSIEDFMRSFRRYAPILCALSALLSLACASAPGASARSNSNERVSDVITEQELADPALAGSSTLEAVQRLRPRFLNQRGAGLKGKDEGPRVSVNGAAFVAVNELAHIGIAEVSEIRYLSIADAGLRFGLDGTMGPVLLVTLRRR